MKLNTTQKIVLGRTLIGIMSFVCLMFLVTFITTLFKSDSTSGQKTTEALSHLFALGLFYFPLTWGIKLYRQGKNERAAFVTLTESPRSIIVTSHIKRADYTKLVYALTYRHPIMQYFTFLGISMLVFQLMQGRFEFLPFQTSFGVLALLLPLSIYFQAKKNYDSNAYLKEAVQYEFTTDEVIVNGETFHHVIKWSSLYRIKELTRWFLLYNSTQTLLVIPKARFESPADINSFRNQILATKGLQKELLQPQ
jgi:hypothetical protein